MNKIQKTTNKNIKTNNYQINKQVNENIKNIQNNDNVGIILQDQTTFDMIFEKSGPFAKSNEFQVHYWSLLLRTVMPDNSIIDIAIPTCYFNYKQKVSSAHIDFTYKDVFEIQNKLLPLHEAKMNELIDMDEFQELLLYIKNKTNTEPVMKSLHSGSIHRHPGSSRSQAFSSTDLSFRKDALGIVYPFEKAGDSIPNFAGIMAIDSGKCHIAHYEYRIANGSFKDELVYQKGKCASFTKGNNPKPKNLSVANNLFDVEPERWNKGHIKKGSIEIIESNFAENIFDLFEKINFNPSTDAIDPENVKEIKTTASYFKTNGTLYNQKLNSFDYFNQEIEELKNREDEDIEFVIDYLKQFKNLPKLKIFETENNIEDKILSMKQSELNKLARELDSIIWGSEYLIEDELKYNAEEVEELLEEAREAIMETSLILNRTMKKLNQKGITKKTILKDRKDLEEVYDYIIK